MSGIQIPTVICLFVECQFWNYDNFFFRKNYFDKDPREDEENLHKSGFSNQDKEM